MDFRQRGQRVAGSQKNFKGITKIDGLCLVCNNNVIIFDL